MYRAREVNIIHSIHMLQKAKMPKASSLISILKLPTCQTRLKSFGGFSVRKTIPSRLRWAIVNKDVNAPDQDIYIPVNHE